MHRIRFAALFLVGSLLLGSAARAQPKLDILVVAPHPDDEALGCAGVMLQAVEQKKRVGIVLLTNGDGFPKAAAIVAKKPVEKLEPADYFGVAALRQQHTLTAMGKIGVRPTDIHFLAYPDSALKALYETKDDAPLTQKFTGKAATYAAVARDYHTLVHDKSAPYTKASVLNDLMEIIKTRTPAEIYVIHEADAHADHKAAFWFTRDAARDAAFVGAFRTYLVHGKPPTDPDLRIPLTLAQQTRKRSIIEDYQTKLSPLHDELTDKFARPEEHFWIVRPHRP